MSSIIASMAARLQRDVPATEGRIDDALVAVSSLMTTIVSARRDIGGVPRRGGPARRSSASRKRSSRLSA